MTNAAFPLLYRKVNGPMLNLTCQCIATFDGSTRRDPVGSVDSSTQDARAIDAYVALRVEGLARERLSALRASQQWTEYQLIVQT